MTRPYNKQNYLQRGRNTETISYFSIVKFWLLIESNIRFVYRSLVFYVDFCTWTQYTMQTVLSLQFHLFFRIKWKFFVDYADSSGNMGKCFGYFFCLANIANISQRHFRKSAIATQANAVHIQELEHTKCLKERS